MTKFANYYSNFGLFWRSENTWVFFQSYLQHKVGISANYFFPFYFFVKFSISVIGLVENDIWPSNGLLGIKRTDTSR